MGRSHGPDSGGLCFQGCSTTRDQPKREEKGFNFPYLYDESQQVARVYGAERTPEVFLFDREGSPLYHGAIDDNYDDLEKVQRHYLRDALNAVLSGKDPAVTETRPVGCTIKWR